MTTRLAKLASTYDEAAEEKERRKRAARRDPRRVPRTWLGKRLYHGTFAMHVPSILRRGLLPAARARVPKNYKGSDRQAVYLSTSPHNALWFADEVRRRDGCVGLALALVEVDVARLKGHTFHVDHNLALYAHEQPVRTAFNVARAVVTPQPVAPTALTVRLVDDEYVRENAVDWAAGG